MCQTWASEWPTEQRYAERTSVLLTSPTGHLRWRWTSPSFTGPPKRQRKTSLNFTLQLVSMETPLTTTYLNENVPERHVLKTALQGPPRLPRGQVHSGPEGTGLLRATWGLTDRQAQNGYPAPAEHLASPSTLRGPGGVPTALGGATWKESTL